MLRLPTSHIHHHNSNQAGRVRAPWMPTTGNQAGRDGRYSKPIATLLGPRHHAVTAQAQAQLVQEVLHG